MYMYLVSKVMTNSTIKVVDSTSHCWKLTLVATLCKMIEYIGNFTLPGNPMCGKVFPWNYMYHRKAFLESSYIWHSVFMHIQSLWVTMVNLHELSWKFLMLKWHIFHEWNVSSCVWWTIGAFFHHISWTFMKIHELFQLGLRSNWISHVVRVSVFYKQNPLFFPLSTGFMHIGQLLDDIQ